MSAVINLTAASSDLRGYLENDWAADFAYRGNGFFNPGYTGSPTQTYTQWAAGDTTNAAESGVILGSDGFNYIPPGGIVGTVDTLTFGYDLDHPSNYTLAADLIVDLGDVAPSATFNQAIFVLSNFGSFQGQTIGGTYFAGLYDYFAEVGTEQNGTSGGDKLYSFGGADVLTGNGGNDTFLFTDNWNDDVVTDLGTSGGNDDIIDLTAITNFTSQFDLIFNHSNWSDMSGVLTISDGTNSLQLDGYVGSDIFSLVMNGNVLV